MTLIETIAILVCLSAGFSYLDYHYIKLPVTIGLMAIALLTSLALLLLAKLGYGIEAEAESFIRSIDFDETLSLGMLLFLLYARTVHVNLDDLLEQKWFIVT
jgi:CPA1 family monovalent cation:H+ antiporter